MNFSSWYSGVDSSRLKSRLTQPPSRFSPAFSTGSNTAGIVMFLYPNNTRRFFEGRCLLFRRYRPDCRVDYGGVDGAPGGWGQGCAEERKRDTTQRKRNCALRTSTLRRVPLLTGSKVVRLPKYVLPPQARAGSRPRASQPPRTRDRRAQRS